MTNLIEHVEGASATYSAEDNKLRIYVPYRLDREEYLKVKDAGFGWAPKQELHVATWTPNREDFALCIAGEITAEGTTLAERAEAKADRLDDLAIKRAKQANSFHDAAQRISQRFEYGQPILVGHHSERKARKDKASMERAQEQSAKAAEAVDYWNYRAAGVERHANRHHAPKVRANRIKKLLADLRDRQRTITELYRSLELWKKVFADEGGEKFAAHVEILAGDYRMGGGSERNYYRKLQNEEITPSEVCKLRIEQLTTTNNSPYHGRWMSHILNRLAYEQSEQGETPLFDGDLTAVILQAFTREHGADKPKAKQDGESWTLTTSSPLPLHIGEGNELTLSDKEWRELMQSCGYNVVFKEKRKPKKQTCSLINLTLEDASKLQKLWNTYAAGTKYGTPSELREVTQAYYSPRASGDYGPFSTVSIDPNGSRIYARYNARILEQNPIFRVRRGNSTGGGMYGADSVMHITDKPCKPCPLDLDALIKAAEEANEAKKAEVVA
jgi:hypothetical protein